MSIRKIYMKNIQFRQIRKQANTLNKKDRTEHSAIFCDQTDRFLNQLQTDFRNQNIAEFIFQNNIL